MADVQPKDLEANATPAGGDFLVTQSVSTNVVGKTTIDQAATAIADALSIATTAPITGGGALGDGLTIAITPASGAAAGSMSAADFSKLAGIEENADVTDAANVAAAGAVMTTRAVSTTAPLSGGGALSGDLTLSVATSTPGAAGVAPPSTPIIETGTTRTLADSDHGRPIIFTNAAGCAVTVPDTVTPGLTVLCIQRGAASVTAAGSGTMVVTPEPTWDAQTFGVGSVMTLYVESSSVCNAFGDLTEAA